MTDFLGYISAFDGLTLVDGSAKKAKNLIGITNTVNNSLYTLPNGTVVNYEGTADSVTSPGSATQNITIKTSAAAFYNSLSAKIGNRGTVTRTNVTTGTQTCTGILVDVKILDESVWPKGFLMLALTFNFETNWA